MPVRRRLISGFIVTWLAVQIMVPFVRKFDFPSFRYRYATFSWAMYSKPALVYDVSLFRTGKAPGQFEPIPNIGQFVHGCQSPEPMRTHEYYRSEAEIQERFTRLITHIAGKAGDGHKYVVKIHWIRSLQPGQPPQWEFSAPGSGRS